MDAVNFYDAREFCEELFSHLDADTYRWLWSIYGERIWDMECSSDSAWDFAEEEVYIRWKE